MDLNHYFSNADLEKTLQEWNTNFPNLVTLVKIGESFEKRPIWTLILTNRETGTDLEKPAVWIDANIHATEIAGTTTALAIAHALLDGYGSDQRITRLIDTCCYYITPRVNPDGAELAMAPSPRYIRSGVRRYPWEEKDDGLHEQDIDGDGRILQMRIPDPNGDWKISSLDPRLLEKRSPIEHGSTYYRLLPEGLLENFDGYIIKVAHPAEGLDFNRNFPFEWRPENEQEGAGPYPGSEAEVRSIIDFIVKHPNINLALTYHTFSRVILRPVSTKPDDELEVEDLWVSKKIGAIGSELTGYPCASTFHDFKYHPKEVMTGGFDDWMYDHLGAFCYTVEIWDLPTEAGIKERKFIDWYRDHPHSEDLTILKWALENGGSEAYVGWYPYEHPQLGKVELGGWNMMYSWRNPPHQYMGAEATRNVPFALALGDMLPHLAIHTLEVKPLGQNDYTIHLVIENTGFLPTNTSVKGKKRKVVRPVRVELELSPEVKLLSGKQRTELGHLEGRSNKLDVSVLWQDSPTDNRARADWTLHAEPGVKVLFHILSERAGSIHKEVTLN